MKDSQTTQVERILAAAEKRMKAAHQDHVNFQLKTRIKKRNHPKRHSENRERSFVDRAKASKCKAHKAAFNEARKTFLVAARKYWKAEGNHP